MAKDRFAADLAGILYDKAYTGAYGRLFIVADPGTLGSLRDEMHMEVSGKVVAEVPKTLTQHPLDEIEKIVISELENA